MRHCNISLSSTGKAHEVAEELEEREMSESSYFLLHPEVYLFLEDKTQVIAGLTILLVQRMTTIIF